jgi:hypothetical protein
MGDADAARLAGDENHDTEAFPRLVPKLQAGELPAEAMAAQVTRLQGGVALGVAMHHAVVDGRSVWRFMQAWAAACRGEGDADLAAAPLPTFDRAAVRLPGGEERACSRRTTTTASRAPRPRWRRRSGERRRSRSSCGTG